MKVTMFVLVLSAAGIARSGAAQTFPVRDSVTTVDPLDRAILIVERKSADEHVAAGAMVVHCDSGTFIVCERKAAEQFSSAARIGLPAVLGHEAQWIEIKNAIEWPSAGPWGRGGDGEILAVARVSSGGEIESTMRALSVPLQSLRGAAPRRGSGVEIVGYTAMLLSVSETPPPVMVFHSQTATEAVKSSLMGDQRLIWAAPILSRPFSGAPVFLHTSEPADMVCVGMFLGNAGDPREGVLAGIVPAAVIREKVERIGGLLPHPNSARGDGKDEGQARAGVSRLLP